MNKNLIKSALISFTIISLTVLLLSSCIIINPQQEKEVPETSSETDSSVSTTDTSASTTESANTTTTETTQGTTSKDTTSTTTSTSQDTNLTQQQAIDIALTVAQGNVERVETEIEDGKLIWKVRIVSGGTRTDVRIDDATGTVLEAETEDD